MDYSMERGRTGQWLAQSVEGRDYEAFLPNDLPPVPSLQWGSELLSELTSAIANVARLDGAARLLPDLNLFLYSYIRKEAVLSSQIEGTQSSLSDLLMFESDSAPGVPLDDVTEVSCYVQALNEGIKRIQMGEDISITLLLDLHKILLSSGRGNRKDPGMIRTVQNWIGGKTPDRAMFVPPPPDNVIPCIQSLISFWKTSKEHTLIKAAYIHSQFETIHPFRDGNGRIGRLLITLLICQEKLISQPMVYLSLFFKENREEYYSKLQSIRTHGTWEDWLIFFLKGISQVTGSAFELTQKIQHLFEGDTNLIREKGGRKAGGMLELYRALQQSPILSIPKAEKILKTRVSKPTLYNAANGLVGLGILSPLHIDTSGTQIYSYSRYVNLLTD